MVLSASITFFLLISLKKGWITVEKKWNYDRYLWGYASLVSLAGLLTIIVTRNLEAVNFTFWYLAIWFTALAYEPVWATILRVATYQHGSSIAFKFWSLLSTIQIIYVAVVVIMYYNPTLQAFGTWLGKLTFGGGG